jgi:UrcA family protein
MTDARRPGPILLLTLALVAGPVLAQADIVVQSRKIPVGTGAVRGEVPFGDLDLTTDAGVATLKGRVEAEAKRICGPRTAGSVADNQDRTRCYDEAMASALPRVEEAAAWARQ